MTRATERGTGWVASVGVVLWATVALGDPVRMRLPEGPTHGFVKLADEGGTVLAHGELVQRLEKGTIANELAIRFDNGSLYREVMRFTQNPTFRVVGYHLVQRGPSFTETVDVEFDRTGRYRARVRDKPGAEEKTAAGHVDLPNDVSNGLVSVLLKNLMPAGSATTHVVSFLPEPTILELHLAPEGTDEYWVGGVASKATRFLVQPRVPGVMGVLATVAGKQPPSVRMWIAQGKVPAMVKIVGPLYADGPTWVIELSGPRWSPS